MPSDKEGGRFSPGRPQPQGEPAQPRLIWQPTGPHGCPVAPVGRGGLCWDPHPLGSPCPPPAAGGSPAVHAAQHPAGWGCSWETPRLQSTGFVTSWTPQSLWTAWVSYPETWMQSAPLEGWRWWEQTPQSPTLLHTISVTYFGTILTRSTALATAHPAKQGTQTPTNSTSIPPWKP